MATRGKFSSGGLAIIAVIVLAMIAAVAWWRGSGRGESASAGKAATPAATATKAPADDGHVVKVSGKFEIGQPPHDTQIGIAAEGLVLLRHVEMYRWVEQCAGDDCTYTTEWSAVRVDSQKFRHPAGHENPAMPFSDARFVASEIRLGGYSVDADLVLEHFGAVALPVDAAALPPNMAASFHVQDGMLYAGGSTAKPQVGEVRISYRVIPANTATLSGVQHGSRLSTN